jgi:glycosyltransferase involved in cell wall biosynthesis
MIYLSIVIPAYNEERRIGKTLSETFAYLDSLNFESEVLVVDDGSTDRTVNEVIEWMQIAKGSLRLIRNPGNRGKGYSVRNGMMKARGEIILFYDADMAVPTTEIVKVIRPISEGQFDVVFGSRYIDGGLIGAPQSMLRRAVSRVGNLIMRWVTGLDYRDMQCGFKAFRASVAKSIFRNQVIDGYGFDPEVLFIATKRGWRLLETPVICNHVEGSKVNILTTPVEVLREVLTIRRNDRLGLYDRGLYSPKNDLSGRTAKALSEFALDGAGQLSKLADLQQPRAQIKDDDADRDRSAHVDQSRKQPL